MKLQNYLDLGWSLVPIKPNEKRPVGEWAQYQTKRASEVEVGGWLKQNYDLGVVTGALSNIDVVDDDRVKYGLNAWGVQSSVVARTRHGARHYYFLHQDGMKNTVNDKIHMDIRAEGGQVLIPPSPGYEWISPPTPENMAKLTMIPKDLLDVIKPNQLASNKVDLSEIMGTEIGGRDNQLLKAANSLVNKYPESDWSTLVYSLVQGVNQTFNPPLPENDVQRIFHQATTFVHNNPKIKQESQSNVLIPHSAEEIACQRAKDREMEGFAPTTGYIDLDKCYRPLVPGRLAVLTGDTNIGKTAFACNLAHRVSEQNKSVLYFALEPDRTLIDYLVTIKKEKTFAELSNQDIADYTNPNLKIFGADQVRTLSDLLATVRNLPRFDLIVVDHVGYFAEASSHNFTAEQAKTLRELALLAQEKMTHILTIAHLNKSFDSSLKSWIPTMNQIAGTASFKQDCDDVLILARKPIETEFGTLDYDSSEEGVIVVGKSKSKKSQSIAPLRFHKQSGLITGRYEIKVQRKTERERMQESWLEN